MSGLIYLFSTVDNINFWLKVVAIIFVLMFLISVICAINPDNDLPMSVEEWGKSKIIKYLFISLSLITLSILTPSSKTMAAMYLIPKMTNSDTSEALSRLPLKSVRLLEKKLDEYLEQEIGIEEKEDK